ncbi:MAG: hypothetical protein IR164_06640 [Devosia sp.]|uniref:hypothetical protein n=1 Tax=unclassified Devosia TaxID=196773 RepID=UPI0019FFE742|nr:MULTISPECIES: hypothetical protein [unclassified Devosia]MBF0678597.1 hypothetical protein [Devosia sp.]WEJ31832.1 hypothetical protein NYQ88_13050 [Devosia sp. SD17-2]
MKKFTLAAVMVAAGLAAVPGIAMAGDSSDSIFGRSEMALEAALKSQGVDVAGVEEWGHYVRAWVNTGNGTTTMQFFDPDTLESVTP